MDGFSTIGRNGRWPLWEANQGKKVSCGSGVIAMCRLAELTVLAVGAAVGSGIAVGVSPPVDAVGGGGNVAGTEVAVAEEPQATMNTRSMEIRTAGFLRMESFISCPPKFGTPSIFQMVVGESLFRSDFLFTTIAIFAMKYNET